MVEIAPFRAFRFNPRTVGEMGRVLSPPYDVVSESERAALESLNSRNIIRLELPYGEGDQKYQEARRLLMEWCADGTLLRDDRPSLYRYAQTFSVPGSHSTLTRRGFFALLKLESFDRKSVLPHERTLSAPKADRMKLMRATQAYISQVFGLYRDELGQTEQILASVEQNEPVLDATMPDGSRHQLWRIANEGKIQELCGLLSNKQIMIADGHHRYETMLQLQQEFREEGASFPTLGYGSVFLARAEDPGLVVLPTHRLIKNRPFDPDELGRRVSKHFTVVSSERASEGDTAARLRALDAPARPAFALIHRNSRSTYWYQLRADADLSALGPVELRGLDVTVLHSLLLGPALGIDAEAMARQSYLGYTHSMAQALREVEKGDVEAAFLMNPTQVQQVLQACEAGFVLPQKSTYFEPKLATGVVLHRFDV